jgi:hypothetical protein
MAGPEISLVQDQGITNPPPTIQGTLRGDGCASPFRMGSSVRDRWDATSALCHLHDRSGQRVDVGRGVTAAFRRAQRFVTEQ